MARLSRASGVSPSPPVSVPDSDAALTTSTSTEQHLLTPATSLSESSSMSGTPVMGVEINDTEGTVTAERRSRRVTRSSLVIAVGGGVVRQERRHIMSSDDERVTHHPLHSNPLLHEGDDGGVELEEEEQNQKTTKKGNETQLGQNELGKRAVSRKGKGSSENGSRRRSSRLVLLEKTNEMVGKASLVPGKRSRGAMLKGKDRLKVINRRASLRPRDVVCEKAAPSTRPPSTADGPAMKKRRVSEDDAVVPKKSSDTSAIDDTRPPKRTTQKKWLSHGLYAGQDRYFDPRLTEEKNRLKFGKQNAEDRKKTFPLPMFAGERLIEDGRDFKLPFDIFSPLPPGQPKPDEWRKTNKNVFVGDAACIWKAIKLRERSTCMCTPELGCDENCQNRYMFYECDDNNCKLGAELCGNRSFEGLRQRIKMGGRYNIGVEVIKTADRGYGVRSNRTFAPNQIIVEYTGEIITQEECERRMRTVYKDNECYYLMYFDQNMIIDATRGSIARMEKWTVAGKPRMALFAGENGIMTGEELTYDYNFDPYSQKNVQQCRCGVPTCRGVLGPKSKDSNRPRSEKQTNSNLSQEPKKISAVGKKRKREKVLDESSTSHLNKRKKILKPASKALKPSIKKAVASTRPATNSNQRAKAKPKPKTKTSAITTVKAKSVPTKKSKVRPRATISRTTPAKQKTQRSAAKTPSQTQPQGNTKLNRPSKKLNSISAARAASRTPAAMRLFLEAGKMNHKKEDDAKETTSLSSRSLTSKTKAEVPVTQRRYTMNNPGKQSKISKTVKRIVGTMRR
ncbi:histone-lysine N-methyltransferase [Histoplasma capsulatum H143]|uniref:Histone-lysine N-methyltransferase n=1 Tax=Ajellomyces capsulatus (strain H143) TaxID=544712 RepID=C6HLV5_AJECH|nr:histone-lysine N-methyltransferase [Histoplasma capsulatum H143]